jgi:hypothetical protein
MNPKSVLEAAEAARQLFQDKESARFWPGPLVRLLEKEKPTTALRWAIQLFQASLSARRLAGLESQQQRWLADLRSLIDCGDVADRCDDVAHEIWNNDPDMNFVERCSQTMDNRPVIWMNRPSTVALPFIIACFRNRTVPQAKYPRGAMLSRPFGNPGRPPKGLPWAKMVKNGD